MIDSASSPQQPQLFGDFETVQAARVAFGRYLRPDFYVEDPNFTTLPEQYKEWFNPTQLEVAMFRPPEGALLTVRIDPSNWRSNRFSLNHAEFALIGRYPEKLAESAVQRTLAAGETNEERVAAAERSRFHAVEGRIDSAIRHTDKLKERKEQLDLFAAKARAAGWAHLKPLDMQELFNLCSQELITMMDVLQARRKWSDEERAQRYEGMIYYLTQGDQRTRVNHWQATIATVRRCMAAKINLFENHIEFNQTWLDERTPDSKPEDPA